MNNEDNFERSKNITELVSSDSVVAVNAEDDNIEYYMLKVTSGNSFEYIVCTVLTLHEIPQKFRAPPLKLEKYDFLA
jgi:hypothetical protein